MKQNQTCKSVKTLTWFGIASMVFFFTTAGAYAEVKNGIPEMINLNVQANHPDIKGLPKDKKSVNSFTHRKHAQEFLKGNSEHAAKPFTDDFTCAACHLGAASPEDITGSAAQERLLAALNAKGGPKKLKNYFHGICLYCHKSMKKAKKATGPTKCKDCHSRG